MEENKNAAGKFLDPEKIIELAGIEKGSVVVDFGCGPGYFSIPLAQAVGEDGKVFSLDILPQALEAVEGKAKNLGIVNITTKRANLEKKGGSKLESMSASWVVMKDILFQNSDKNVIIEEAHRILKDGGKILIVEWNKKESLIGPAAEIRIAKSDLERILSDQKFVTDRDIDAGDFHYAVIASKS
ncbi:MAG: hypothetical protein ACD_8C00094G0011 [uncultured bacterium]|nr:MAG: hypothetical protein ACD_8C00094G0011 [uncultured bacterium]